MNAKDAYPLVMNQLANQYKNFDFAINPAKYKNQDLEKDVLNITKSQLADLNELEKKRLTDEIFSLGPLSGLVGNAEITEIMINRYDSIWIEHDGKTIKATDTFFTDCSYLNFLDRLYLEAQIEPNLNLAFVDGHWRGFRVHVSLPPLVRGGPHLCLRRHPQTPWTLEKLKACGWSDTKGINLIESLIDNKNSFLVVGATSSGKTSAITAALQKVYPNERVVIIEDTLEVVKPNALSVNLLTRSSTYETVKNYNLSDLLIQSLRMRPDRIVVGEVRGSEAKDLLMALATGHRGGLGTLHADNPRQALYRLEMLVQMGAPQWSLDAIRQLILMSLSHIVLVKKVNTKRVLASVHKIASLETTGFCLETLYEGSA